MSNNKSSIFGEFSRIFGLAELEEVPQVELFGCTYYVQVQALKVVSGKNDLILNTKILLLEKPQYTSIPVVVGYLKGFNHMIESNPDLWNSPEFVEAVEHSADFNGEQGYLYAKNRIQDLTPDVLKQALHYFIGKGKELRPHVLKMCVFELLRRQVICLYETEAIEMFEPPKYYDWHGVIYELNKQRDDSECVYSLYYPAGSINNV
jgi:hypothetical protein